MNPWLKCSDAARTLGRSRAVVERLGRLGKIATKVENGRAFYIGADVHDLWPVRERHRGRQSDQSTSRIPEGYPHASHFASHNPTAGTPPNEPTFAELVSAAAYNFTVPTTIS